MPAVPAVSGGFGDLIDPRFQKIWNDVRGEMKDMLPMLYRFESTNGRADMRYSDIGAFGNWEPFVGEVTYQSVAQGYDTTVTPLEFTSGFQVERKLYDDDQYNVMDARPSGLARAWTRTRQVDGASMFNNAFSLNTQFYVNSEAVALCSNSHTTTNDTADTSSGFDNLVTTSLTAAAVAAARVQMVNFRDDAGNVMPVEPDELMIAASANYEIAYEIVASMGKVDSMNNNRNVHEGAYRIIEWNYLTDTDNWFMMDSRLRNESLIWTDRVPVEMAYIEDFDTLVAKWRGYARYGMLHRDWRWILGAQVG